MFYKDDRLVLLIDGPSLHSASRALGFEIDYNKLRQEFMRRGKMIRAHYYTTYFDTDEHQPVKPLCDWMSYNGFSVVMKAMREFTDPTGRKKIKGGIGIELTVDAMSIAQHCDHVVLFSGDGEYRILASELQRRGIRVSVVSTLKSQPPIISDDLRRQADNFIELDDLKSIIGRTPRRDADGDEG